MKYKCIYKLLIFSEGQPLTCI